MKLKNVNESFGKDSALNGIYGHAARALVSGIMSKKDHKNVVAGIEGAIENTFLEYRKNITPKALGLMKDLLKAATTDYEKSENDKDLDVSKVAGKIYEIGRELVEMNRNRSDEAISFFLSEFKYMTWEACCNNNSGSHSNLRDFFFITSIVDRDTRKNDPSNIKENLKDAMKVFRNFIHDEWLFHFTTDENWKMLMKSGKPTKGINLQDSKFIEENGWTRDFIKYLAYGRREDFLSKSKDVICFAYNANAYVNGETMYNYYGKNIVLFKGDGYEFHHEGDGDNQVLVSSRSIHDAIFIRNVSRFVRTANSRETYDWEVVSPETGNIIKKYEDMTPIEVISVSIEDGSNGVHRSRTIKANSLGGSLRAERTEDGIYLKNGNTGETVKTENIERIGPKSYLVQCSDGGWRLIVKGVMRLVSGPGGTYKKEGEGDIYRLKTDRGSYIFYANDERLVNYEYGKTDIPDDMGSRRPKPSLRKVKTRDQGTIYFISGVGVQEDVLKNVSMTEDGDFIAMHMDGSASVFVDGKYECRKATVTDETENLIVLEKDNMKNIYVKKTCRSVFPKRYTWTDDVIEKIDTKKGPCFIYRCSPFTTIVDIDGSYLGYWVIDAKYRKTNGVFEIVDGDGTFNIKIPSRKELLFEKGMSNIDFGKYRNLVCVTSDDSCYVKEGIEKSNIYDIEKKKFVFDKWFDSIDFPKNRTPRVLYGQDGFLEYMLDLKTGEVSEFE